MQTSQFCLLVFSFTVVTELHVRSSLCMSKGYGTLAWKDAIEELTISSLERFQACDALYAQRGENTHGAIAPLDILYPIHPFHGLVPLGKDALIADEGQPQHQGYLHHRCMQALGKWMGGIYEQANIMLATELLHCRFVHGSIDAYTKRQDKLLLTSLGAVEERFARLFQHFCSLAAFCGTAENENHSELSRDGRSCG